MHFFVRLTGLLMLFADTPLMAQASSEKSGRAAATGEASAAEIESLARDTEAFAQWTLRLTDAAAPAIEQVRGLQGEWAQTTASRSPELAAQRFYQFIDATRASLAASRADIAALDTPQFAPLNLPDDLQPVTLRRQMSDTLGQMDEMVAAFRPLLQSMIARDDAAGRAAGVQMFRSARVMYDSQRLFARASLATSEAGTADYHAIEFDILFYDAGGRIIDAASRLMADDGDPTLAGDLLRYADQIDRVTDAALAAARAQKAEAESSAVGTGASAQQIVERARRIDELSVENFGIWRRFSADLRSGAAQMQSGPLTFAKLRLVTDVITPTRAALDEIAIRQMQVLAGERR